MADDTQKEAQEYLDDLADWQEHQYSPGRYLGGNLPFAVKHRLGKHKWVRVLIGLFLLAFLVLLVVLLWRMVAFIL